MGIVGIAREFGVGSVVLEAGIYFGHELLAVHLAHERNLEHVLPRLGTIFAPEGPLLFALHEFFVDSSCALVSDHFDFDFFALEHVVEQVGGAQISQLVDQGVQKFVLDYPFDVSV